MRNNLLFLMPPVVIFSFLNISCAHYFHGKHKHKKDSLAVVSPVNNSKVKGWVHFKKLENKQVLVRAKILGLEPNKKYGFHIHKYGDCRENGKNAGAHLGSHKNKHGAPHSEEKHMGDLGNLKTGKKGVAVYQQVLDICMRKIGGRSVIIHANEDDLKSQPSGNAGPYIGCGIIGYVKKSDHKKEAKKPVEAKKEAQKKEVKKPAENKKEELKKEQTTKIKKETKVIEIKEEKTTKIKKEVKKSAENKKEEPKKEAKKPVEAKKEAPKKDTEKKAAE